jgi:hypothetical protein
MCYRVFRAYQIRMPYVRSSVAKQARNENTPENFAGSFRKGKRFAADVDDIIKYVSDDDRLQTNYRYCV